MLNGYNGKPIEDANVVSYTRLISPSDLKNQMPLTDQARRTVEYGRRSIRNILQGYDSRLLLLVGPCSIDNVASAQDYGERLNGLAKRVSDVFVVVTRTYFEKPRTTVGWKGLAYEPRLNGQEEQEIYEELILPRRLLLHNAEIGLPSGRELLDPIFSQYAADLTAWGSIGARTAESQLHRELASASSMPIGFKNSTQGDVQFAINSMVSARQPHKFYGIDQSGVASLVKSRGNPYTHIILRGGNGSTNYDEDNVEKTRAMLRKAELNARVMTDCSHGNSNRDYRLQPVVFEYVIREIVDGNTGIMGLMLESNINEGSQKVPGNLSELKYGVSITDSCIGWETTEKIILGAHEMLSRTRSH